MSKKTDVLYKAVDHINDLNNHLTTVIPTISYVSNELQKVTTSLDLVNKLMKEVHTLEQSIATLKNVCKGLSFIPIIGTVCSEISTICESVRSILAGLDHPIQDIRKTLEKMDNYIKKMNHQVENVYQKLSLANAKIPSYTSSFDVLIALFEITDIVELDTEILKEINKIETEITDLNQFIQTYRDKITSIEKEFKTDIQNVTTKIQSVRNVFGPFINVFNEIGKVINPIAKGLDTVCNVIKPLKWVLNAFSWLFNKILKPAIKKVLQITGLQKLIDSFEHAITKLLHLDQLKNEVEKIGEQVVAPLTTLEQKMGDLFNTSLDQLYTQLDQTLSSESQTKVITKMVDHYLDYLNDDTPFTPIKIKNAIRPFMPLCLTLDEEEKNPTYLPLMRQNRTLKQSNVMTLANTTEDIKHPKLQELLHVSHAHEINLERIKEEVHVISTFKEEKDLLYSLFETTMTYIKMIDEKVNHEDTKKLLQTLEHCLDRANDKLNHLEEHLATVNQVICDFNDYHLKMAHASPSGGNITTVDQAFSNLIELKSYPEKIKNSIDTHLTPSENPDSFSSEVCKIEKNFNNGLDQVLDLVKEHHEKSTKLYLTIEQLNQHNGLFHEKIWNHASTLHNMTVKLHALSHPLSVILDAVNSTVFQHYGEELILVKDWVHQHLTFIPLNKVEQIADELFNLLLPDSFIEKLEASKHAIDEAKDDSTTEKAGLLLSRQIEKMQTAMDQLEQNPYLINLNHSIANAGAQAIELTEILETNEQYETQFSNDKYQVERYIHLFNTLIHSKEALENEAVTNYLLTSLRYWETCLQTENCQDNWQKEVSSYQDKIQATTLTTLTKYNETLQQLFHSCYQAAA